METVPEGLSIRLFYFDGCPNAAPVRELVVRCLEQMALDTHIEEVVGELPSPTLHINGRDVMGQTMSSSCSCRLDLPTEERVLSALRSAGASNAKVEIGDVTPRH